VAYTAVHIAATATPAGLATSKEKHMLKGFKQFLMRGNVVDLAVAVVIGAAFGGVVDALVKDLLTPIIAAIVGKPDFSAIQFTVNGSQFLIGAFINAVLSFVFVAAAIYFFVVTPMNMINERRKRGEAPADPTTKTCPECLSEVPIAARRCAHCTQPIA
jgi:large conductance mechanosensitive channel